MTLGQKRLHEHLQPVLEGLAASDYSSLDNSVYDLVGFLNTDPAAGELATVELRVVAKLLEGVPCSPMAQTSIWIALGRAFKLRNAGDDAIAMLGYAFHSFNECQRSEVFWQYQARILLQFQHQLTGFHPPEVDYVQLTSDLDNLVAGVAQASSPDEAVGAWSSGREALLQALDATLHFVTDRKLDYLAAILGNSYGDADDRCLAFAMLGRHLARSKRPEDALLAIQLARVEASATPIDALTRGVVAMRSAEVYFSLSMTTKAEQALIAAVCEFFRHCAGTRDSAMKMFFTRYDDWLDDVLELALTIGPPVTYGLILENLARQGYADLIKGEAAQELKRSDLLVRHNQDVDPDENHVSKLLEQSVARDPYNEPEYDISDEQTVFLYAMARDAKHTQGARTYMYVRTNIGTEIYSRILTPHVANQFQIVTRTSLAMLRGRDWQRLAEALLPSGLMTSLSNLTNLVIVPIGSVASFPFAALPVGDRALGELVNIVTTPDPDLVLTLENRPRTIRNVVVLGADQGESAEYGVPGLESELACLQSLGAVIRTARTWEALAEALVEPADMLIIAAHGFFESGRSWLLLPSGELVKGPQFASLPVPELVVAGACWTGAVTSTQSPFGLVPALLAGGARAVVSALWDVDSEACSTVLREFYGQVFAGVEPVSALADAQRACSGLSRFDRFGLVVTSAPAPSG